MAVITTQPILPSLLREPQSVRKWAEAQIAYFPGREFGLTFFRSVSN